MTCSDVERVLPELLDGAPDGAYQTEFENHLKSCPACSDLVSDMALISGESRQLAATDEPPARVWVRIAAELRAEGLIREPGSQPARPTLVPASTRPRWAPSAWWLAPVAAALFAAGSYVVSHKPAPQVAQQQAPAASQTPATSAPSVAPAIPEVANASPVARAAAKVAPASVPASPPLQVARKSAPPTVVGPASSADDQQFLREVSTRAPSMRATYESQLQAVNSDIRETQEYVDRNPGDADARQHLMDAYEQKALLYQIALDHIQ
jgi:hypothetical protein